MKPSELEKVLAVAIENRHPLLIVGPPGIGKSDIVAQCCDRAGAKLLVFHPVVSDPTDFKGLPFARDGEAEFLPFGELKLLTSASEPTVAFLDDLGQAPASVQAAAMQLLLSRKINGHRVSDLVTFVAATNRREDRAGVQAIIEPVKSRFVSLVHLEVDLGDWAAWAAGSGLPRSLIAFVRARPALLHDFQPTAALENSPCPRTVAFAGRILQAGYPEEAIEELIAGACGEGFAIEFEAFRKLEAEIPTTESVFADPENAPVPGDPSVICSLCAALAQEVGEETVGALMTYLGRLPAEYSTLTVKEFLRRDRSLGETEAVVRWSNERSGQLQGVA